MGFFKIVFVFVEFFVFIMWGFRDWKYDGVGLWGKEDKIFDKIRGNED